MPGVHMTLLRSFLSLSRSLPAATHTRPTALSPMQELHRHQVHNEPRRFERGHEPEHISGVLARVASVVRNMDRSQR